MKLKRNGLYVIILCVNALAAQVGINTPKSRDSAFVIHLNESAKSLVALNNDSALINVNYGLNIARELNNEYLIFLGYDNKGVILSELGKWNQALYYFDKSISFFTDEGWFSEAGQSYLHLGNLYKSEGEMLELSSDFEMADSSFLLALTNYKKALNQVEKNKDSLWMAHAHLNIGAAHFKLFEDTKALINYRKAVSLFSKLGAASFLPGIYSNVGLVHQNTGQLDSADFYFSAAREAFKKQKNLKNWINSNINLANIYENENPTKAILLLKEADSLARELNNVVQQSILQEYLYTVYRNKGDFKNALNHLENHMVIKDSILNKEFKTEELNVRYQTAKQQETIERQRAENLHKELNLNRAETEKKKLIALVVISFLALTALLAFSLWRQRTKAIIQKQKDLLQRQKITDLKRAKKLEATKAMLEGEEKERLRIAQSLHDRLGSTLAAARMQLEASLDDNSKGDTPLSKVENLLDRAIDDTRSISHNLVSGVLIKLGLVAAIKDLKESLQITNKLAVNLQLDFTLPLAEEIELQVFRIIQELINNILKHSGATQIDINLTIKEDKVVLVVEDNGQGFDSKKISTGLGFQNIDRRATAISGTYKIQSSIGKGCQFKLQFPYSLK